MDAPVLNATEDELKLAQAKITYLGDQRKPIPTVVFYTESSTLVMERFRRVQPSPDPYSNDELPYTMQFAVTPKEVRRILLAVKPVMEVSGRSKPPEFLSFTVVRETNGQIEGCEFAVTARLADGFYRKIINALEPTNEAGRKDLTKQYENVVPPRR
jgi:hypothetical protein